MKYNETKSAALTIVSWTLAFAFGFILCKAVIKPVFKVNLAKHCLVKEIIFDKGYNYENRK